MTDENDVRRIALSLPEAVDGQDGFEVGGKGFAWFYREKVAGQKGRVVRRDCLAVRVADENEKQALLATDSHKFFTTGHYNGYPAILVRLTEIDADELTELLTDGWRCRAPRKLVAAFDKDAVL